ncbi:MULTISPECIES: bifunctional DNA primase/polymerase [Halobacterium]|uniref:bifunctional DNA primase/polymerase n=1 Tax=Halobacterium TaxID=2239 RepID=UPI00073E4242|nr:MULTISPECIES: bifunctional DNA primase/polymerase [Halobacterium]MCG1004874.1 bifunctional DNA primase/polymerase [Halobacterium noricense]
MSEARDRVAARLEEAGVDPARFVDVEDGEKGSFNHDMHAPDAVEGNYGIYATAEDRLIILDVDDYDDVNDRSGLTALSELPATLEQKSPHGGTHRLYAVEETVDGRLIADVFEDELGTKNPKPSWGEVRVANQYVVGAGSELNGCDKDWCEDCAAEDGGQYELHADREIATISPADVLSVLQADPNYREDDDDTDTADEPPQNTGGDANTEEALSYALNKSNDDKIRRLWRGDYSDYNDDRSRAESALAYKLAFWLQGDKSAVRRAMNGSNLPEDVSPPNLQKWSERQDESYRSSVLKAVDKQGDYWDPSHQRDPDPSTVDYSEVERGEAILRAETGPEKPAGELEYRNGCYGYEWVNVDEDGNVVDEGFDQVTNFTLETVSYLDTYEGELLTIEVNPNHPMGKSYEVEVHPTVFNEAREFREEVVRGRTTWFQPSQANRTSQQVLSDLRQTVGSQMAPEHTGTEFIGVHGQEYDEWVTPSGTLTPEGWAEDAEYKFYEKGGDMDSSSSLAEKWALNPDDGDNYDEGTVANICETLPWTRMPERGLPVLGWYYAAPLKPLIFDEFGPGGERQFNLLQVVGGTGTGKTSTLEMYYELFGANPNPYGCGDKGFTIEKKLSSSCGLPIWLDEYKPTDLAQGKMDWLHRRFREVFRGQSISKGRPSLGEVTFHLQAPVVYSGEQVVEKPAVRRRTIVTQFSSSSTKGEYRDAFKELQGREYNFRDHALAYYQYILNAETEALAEKWEAAGETVDGYLKELGIDSLNEDSEVQGLRTIVFGYEVFQEFAAEMGADVDALPGEDALRDAIQHVAENVGPDGRRREHIDEFTELVAQAALEDYLEEGVHYRIVDSQKHGGKVLAFHMPTTFSAVKKYLREFNLENEHSLLSKTDFLDNYDDKAGDASAYPVGTNQQVRNLENGRRAVHIDIELASETLGEEFELGAFTDVEEPEDDSGEDEESDSDGTVPLADLEDAYGGPGSLSVRVTVSNTLEPKPWLQAEGTVEDELGDTIDFQARGDSNPLPANAEGKEYIIHNVRLTSGEYGEPLLEFRPDTEFEPVASTPDDQQSVTEPVADGGDMDSSDVTSAEGWEPPADAEGREADAKRVVASILAASEDSLDEDNLKLAVFDRFDELKGNLQRVDAGIEAAVTDYGWLIKEDGEFRKA